ncbi:MAG TPA: isoprenylcysteine carboxylmethyltransferase family protein [Candidatus Acidoferrales bacterium]|jgi:protein-S-isoprenylcysteine O-methyltransferase Ste14|nr:isoprenylcysteine carboxylmethyltransferase family protein [Candidatus Acidoferrales bacterium]
MRFDLSYAIDLPWLIFLGYWLVASLSAKKIERHEPSGEKFLRIGVALVAFFLLDSSDPRFGVLNRRFLPWSLSIFALGAALTWAGVAFAIWARYHIGRYWSASVALKAGHELVRTGPYARIRHPIYTGILLSFAGTAIAIGRYRGIVAFAIMLIAFIWKSKKEEALLAGQFGMAFDEHRRHTGFFLPRLSGRPI